jgi:AAA domain
MGGLPTIEELTELLADKPRLPGLTHAEALALQVPPTHELVEQLVEAGTVGTIAALPELHKSWLALELAHALAVGGRVLDRFDVPEAGRVGYWWQDDSIENELRRIQAYARRHDYTEPLPIRWHLNEGLRLPDDLGELRAEIERERQVFVVLDSLYNFVRPGVGLKEEVVGDVFAAVKAEVCDPTGAAVCLIDHAPWPTEGNRNQRRAYGSVFKAAAIRWGIYLHEEAGTLYLEARGNNLSGLARTAVAWSAERLALQLIEPRTPEVDLADAIADFLHRNPGATTTAVTAVVAGRSTTIKRLLRDDERFTTVPPVMFGKPRNATCWACAEDAASLLDEF